MELARKSGIGAQFGGKYFALDARVIRLPRHGASCPVGHRRLVLGRPQHQGADRPRRPLARGARARPRPVHPGPVSRGAGRRARRRRSTSTARWRRSSPSCRSTRSPRPLKLTGTIVVARDIAHAKIKERLDRGEGMPDYLKDHPGLLRRPRQDPRGHALGLVRPDDRRPDGQLRRPLPVARRLDGHDRQGQPLAGRDRRLQEARRLLPRLDRRPRRAPGRRRTSRRSSCSSTPSSAWKPSTRSTSSTSRRSSSSTTRGTSSSRSCPSSPEPTLRIKQANFRRPATSARRLGRDGRHHVFLMPKSVRGKSHTQVVEARRKRARVDFRLVHDLGWIEHTEADEWARAKAEHPHRREFLDHWQTQVRSLFVTSSLHDVRAWAAAREGLRRPRTHPRSPDTLGGRRPGPPRRPEDVLELEAVQRAKPVGRPSRIAPGSRRTTARCRRTRAARSAVLRRARPDLPIDRRRDPGRLSTPGCRGSPDRGGSNEAMAALTKARATALSMSRHARPRSARV